MDSKKKALFVAVIVDPMGSSQSSPEEEIEDHIKRFSLILPDFDLQFSTPKCVMPDLSADLVIYDFGGMMPGNSLMEDNSRQIVKWAQDHPSSLVVVVSTWTYRAYVKPEVEALGLTVLKNVVQDDYDVDLKGAVPSWFRSR